MHSVWLDCFSEICLYRNRTLHAVFWPINYLTLFKTVFTVSTYAGFFVFLFQPSLCAAFFQDPFAPSLMVPAVIGLGNRCCLQAWDESSAFAFLRSASYETRSCCTLCLQKFTCTLGPSYLEGLQCFQNIGLTLQNYSFAITCGSKF
jgi:hypothetical protein